MGLTLKAKTPILTPREVYKSYLKNKYLEKIMPNYGKWPESTSKKYINLATIQNERCRLSQEKKSKALIYGDLNKINHKGSITFEDLAIPSKEGVLTKFVLVEGAPGVGKSTFAWEACRKWANEEILQDYELVILIRLRDESVRKAKCLEDLIQYPHDPKIREIVVDEVTKTGGKGVLLLLEGYDELPSSLQAKESLFRQVINGYQFCEGTVVVTSRHWASEPFLLPNSTTERPVSQHIEILGFTRENIDEYLSNMLLDEPSLFADMKQYLEAYPHIHSMMYIPLNCAIVLEVYRESNKQSLPFPTTMTELYYSLICCLLLRHIGDLPEYEDKRIKLDSISELPQPLKEHFDNLAKLAYEGICNRNQQIIFTEENIDPKIAEHGNNLIPNDLDNQTLGLMQTSMELHYVTGAKKSFNFLHLTIQEFLAAYHILTFTTDDQIKWFRDHTRPFAYSYTYNNEETVFRFLAGLSREAFETALADASSAVLKLKKKMICTLFEAKLELSNRQVIVNPSVTEYVHPHMMYMLGSIIANSSHTCHWDVHINNDSKDFMQMFILGISNKKCESKLSLHIHTIERLNLSLSKLNCTLEHLHIMRDGDEVHVDSETGVGDIYPTGTYYLYAPFSDIFSSGLHIKHLRLTSLAFELLESQKIESYLKSTPSIKWLTLEYCTFTSMSDEIKDVLPGVQACNNLEKLCIHTSHDVNDDSSQCSWDNVRQMLRENKSLREFKMKCDIEILSSCKLPIEYLCTNTTIRKLVISCYEAYWCYNEESYIYEESDWMGRLVSKLPILENKLAKMVKKNKTLTDLKVKYRSKYLYYKPHTYQSCLLAKAMCENNTLQKLSIYDNYHSATRIDEFASMLKENTTLKEFSWMFRYVSAEDKWMRDFKSLTSSLAQNKTLLKLQVKYRDNLSPQCHEAIATERAKDHRLVCRAVKLYK